MNKLFRQAFTLIELLVVITIIGILSGLIVVTMGGVSNKASIAKAQVFSNSLRNSLMLDLVSEWKLDEIIGTVPPYTTPDTWGKITTTLTDTSGACSFAPPYKCPQQQTNCVFNKCLSFDGIDDYIAISSLSSTSIHGPSTIEVWFNSTSPSGYIFSDHCVEWGIYLSNNTVYGTIYSSISGGTISLNDWHHAVVIHEHPTSLTNTKISFYVDGIKKGESTLTITTQNGYYDAPFYLGNDNCATGRFFTGLIDNARYYDAAISSSQIKEQYYIGLNQLLINGGITKTKYAQRIDELSKNLQYSSN